MRLNFLFYNARNFDGYGRYATRLVQAMQRVGVDVAPHFEESLNAPRWMQEQWGLSWDGLTISCIPPYFLQKSPGRHWLLSMTEGSLIPPDWAKTINASGVERVIVPCEHNAEAFRNSGVTVPVSVVPGGTDPDEYPLRQPRQAGQPYTFLALADRGDRKGWSEVYEAFFRAFGTVSDTGPDKVRLIVKCRPGGNDMIDMILDKCADVDPRITFMANDLPDMRTLYEQVDCFAIPSRSEGWGLPHRECAAMGIPVITQAYSGMDDGHTHEWALVVEGGRMQAIPTVFDDHLLGEWRVADVGEVASAMRACYEQPAYAAELGYGAAAWLRANQTWEISCQKLIDLMVSEGVWH